MLTFEQFTATRTECDDLAAAVQSENWETEGTPKGNLYLGCLYIERVQAHWPAESRAAGSWCLTIDRDCQISDDLNMLERALYDFAASEGYEA